MNASSKWMAALGLAATLGLAGAASAGAPAQGIGILTQVDLTARTVTIGGQLLRVTSATVIRDAEGGRIELKDVPVSSRNLSALELMAQYDAVESPRGRVLRTLEMTPVPR